MNKKSRDVSHAREHAQGIEINGRIYLVLSRNKSSNLTDICPFCGERHRHGEGDGHRVSHCVNTDCDYVIGRYSVFKNRDGQLFDSNDGYVIKTIFPS